MVLFPVSFVLRRTVYQCKLADFRRARRISGFGQGGTRRDSRRPESTQFAILRLGLANSSDAGTESEETARVRKRPGALDARVRLLEPDSHKIAMRRIAEMLCRQGMTLLDSSMRKNADFLRSVISEPGSDMSPIR